MKHFLLGGAALVVGLLLGVSSALAATTNPIRGYPITGYPITGYPITGYPITGYSWNEHSTLGHLIAE